LPKLNDESPLVRKNTALSLMKLEDPSAIQALEMQSETEPDDTVKPILRLAINQLHQHD